MPPRSPTWESKYSHAQSAAYLSNLRSHRPVRPTGSRPAPFRVSHLPRSDSHHSAQTEHDETIPFSQNEIANSDRHSISSTSQKGRPLVNAPTNIATSIRGRNISPTAVVQQHPGAPGSYDESTARKLEKEEAHTLREALHIIDQRDEEQRIYEAAQQEAADLVWKHRYPQAAENEKTAPYFNPEHRNKKSYGNNLPNVRQPSQRNISDSSTSSNDTKATRSSKRSSRPKDRVLSNALQELQLASEERSAAIIEEARVERRRSSGRRITSNGSGRTVFRNPQDQIFEESESMQTSHNISRSPERPLQARDRNSLPWGSRPLPNKPGNIPGNDKYRLNRVEIHRNPPSQSRNAAYTLNNTTAPQSTREANEPREMHRSDSNLEVRGDDIRAATSMKKKDRSPKLPTPVAVSDQLGRPIVSFDPAWRPTSDSPRSSQDMTRPVIKLTESPRTSKDIQRPLPRPLPSINEPINSAPAVPTINLPGDGPDIPSIEVSDDTTPMIAVSGPEEPSMATAPKPVPRPLPRHAATTPASTGSPRPNSSRLPWLKSGSSAIPTVSCSSCGLAISGRVVTASGSATTNLKARLHPECFVCFHCSTPLEAVAFYPEPDNKRAERLEAEGIAGDSLEADARFFCHLDFHELFSPRCRSCKTPIEGQVIVAAGAEWHPGHFFCGECGDPFDSETPFVEKDGYAYCVKCHTKRTSARCRECKQLIQDELTVEALGGKWHEHCFVCFECGGDFGEEGRFFIREVPIEPSEKEKRKGITRKMEEKAVCQGCEERRLKA